MRRVIATAYDGIRLGCVIIIIIFCSIFFHLRGVLTFVNVRTQSFVSFDRLLVLTWVRSDYLSLRSGKVLYTHRNLVLGSVIFLFFYFLGKIVPIFILFIQLVKKTMRKLSFFLRKGKSFNIHDGRST